MVKGTRAAVMCCGLGMAWGCAPSQPPTRDTPTPYASYVGDRAQVEFDELVVSLRLRAAETPYPYQNLHVGLTLFVNPAETTTSSSSSYSSGGGYAPQAILKRTERRVAVRLLDVLGGLGEQSLDDTSALRRRIAAEAQQVVDDVMKQWKYGSEFRIEVAVTRLYWTAPVVGPASPRMRFPWE